MKFQMMKINELNLTAEQFDGVSQNHPSHCHEEMVIGLLTEGKRILKIRHKDEIITSGSIFLIPSFTAHQCISMDENFCSWKTIRIHTDWKPSHTVLNIPELNALFLKLHQVIFDQQEEADILPVLNHMIFRLKETAGICVRKSCDSDIQKTVFLNFLIRQCSEKTSLQDLCFLMNLSRSSIERLSRRISGLSTHQLLISMRISRSRICLEQGLLPVQAAVECGFADQSHFSHVFSSVMAVSPSVFGRSFRNSLLCQKSESGRFRKRQVKNGKESETVSFKD